MLKAINPRDSRGYTRALLELVDEGILDRDQLIQDLLGWMDEADVEQFCKKNLRDDDTNKCLIGPEEDDEELDPMDDYNYVGSPYHY